MIGQQWAYSSGSDVVLWKMMFLEPGLIVCENRLRESSRTFFACLSERSGQEILTDFSLDEDGDGSRMTGLETTQDNLFYLHGYYDNSPEHLGLWAVDPCKAEVLWARRRVTCVGNLASSMLAYTLDSFAGFPKRNFMLLDYRSGEVLDELQDDAQKINTLRQQVLSDETLQHVFLPRMAESPVSLPGETGEGPREYIEHGDVTIIVRHEQAKKGKGWNAVLSVWNQGSKWYEDELAAGTAFPCVNYFLLRGVTLYYVKNMNQLISLRL